MRRVLGAMGAALVVVALGLFAWSASLDDDAEAEALAESLYGVEPSDVAERQDGLQTVSLWSAVAGGVLLVGAAAAQPGA